MSDATDIAVTGESRELARSVETGAGMLQMIAEAARDPSVDAQKMVTLANLATSLQDREREAQFNRDKIAAIMEMPSITKRGEIKIPANREKNTPERIQGRYAKFEDMHRAVMPILARHNLVLTFNVDHQGNLISVQPILSHANGHVEKGGVMVLPIDNSGSKNPTQGAGSAASYGKRHQMKAVLNIIEDGEDIDGLGSLPDDQLNDRQERLIVEAEHAATIGSEAYTQWFGRQQPKDRAWLVGTGRHAALGGAQTALPAAAEAQSVPAGAADEWTQDFAEDVIRNAENLAALERAWRNKAMAPFRTVLQPMLDARKTDLAARQPQPAGDLYDGA